MASSILDPQIEAASERAQTASVRTGKIARTGRGFRILLVDPTQRMDVIRALSGRGLFCNGHFTEIGTQGWKIYR